MKLHWIGMVATILMVSACQSSNDGAPKTLAGATPVHDIAGRLCPDGSKAICIPVTQTGQKVRWNYSAPMENSINHAFEGTYVTDKEFVGQEVRHYPLCTDAIVIHGYVTGNRLWSHTVEIAPGYTACDGYLQPGQVIQGPKYTPEQYADKA